MATLREYFDRDFSKTLSVHKPWTLADGAGNVITEIVARIHLDMEANARYWSFFVPNKGEAVPLALGILGSDLIERCVLGPEGAGVLIEAGHADLHEKMSSETLVFTNRAHLYLDFEMSGDERRLIIDAGLKKGVYVVVRDRGYSSKRSEYEQPLAFVSHDSRDKDELVRDLALQMTKLMCPVWYDEYSLGVGDSLRESIEAGLRNTRNCIVVLSPNFLSNSGWAKAEFDSIYTREIVEKQNVMLPVWHNVSVEQVYEYSPRLADKVGLNSADGSEELARKLVAAVRKGDT